MNMSLTTSRGRTMRVSFMSLCRAAAQACLAGMILVHSAQAAPATTASVRAFLDAAAVPQQLDATRDAMLGFHEGEWRAETDPQKKAAKKDVLDEFNRIAGTKMAWESVEPIAIASYQAHLSESDVRELTAHARSPAGQLINRKMGVALAGSLPAHQQFMATTIAEMTSKNPPPAMPAVPPPGPKGALLLAYLRAVPGEEEAYRARMAPLEGIMMQVVDDQGGEAGAARRARVVADMRTRLSFENLMTYKAQTLVNVLSDADIALLIEDNRRPERAEQLRKLRLAENEFQARMMRSR